MLLQRMVLHQSVCLRRLAQGNHSTEIKHGRFLANPAVTVAGVIASWSDQTREAAGGRHVLALQDTSEIKFAASAEHDRGLGKVKKGNCRGVLLHPMLALDAVSGVCLGLAAGQVWTRGPQELTPHGQRPLNEKESRRWIETAQAAKPVLSGARMVTFIADRESDFYALWASLPEERFHVMARVMNDHALASGSTLRAIVEATAVSGTSCIALRERASRPARQVTLSLRFGQAAIRRPKNAHLAHLPASVALNWVEVAELSAPSGVEPLNWLILTSHAIASPADAWQIIAWYQKRWVIEQFFRTLKQQGLNIEESQLQAAPRLEKLAAIAAKAAVIVMQLVQARSGSDPQQAQHIFTPSETGTLAALEQRYQKTTPNQINPHPKRSLAWAAWIIARLGGWNGYASSKPPGPITFYNGLRYFRACAEGWALKDVYMP